MTHICKPSTQELRQEIKNSRVARLQREIQLPIEKGGWVRWGGRIEHRLSFLSFVLCLEPVPAIQLLGMWHLGSPQVSISSLVDFFSLLTTQP